MTSLASQTEITVAAPLSAAVSPGEARGRFIAAPPTWLPAGSRAAGGSQLVELRSGPLRRTARVEVADPLRVGDRVSRRIRWEVPNPQDAVQADPRFPAFDGVLELRGPASVRAPALLVLQGSYTPPGGVVGSVIDRLLGRQVAVLTCQTLLDDIVGALVHANPASV